MLPVGGPPALPGSVQNYEPPDLIDVEPIDISDIQLPDTSVLERMEAMISRRFQRNPYVERMMPRVMEAVGAMLGGGFQIDLDVLDQGVVANLNHALQKHNDVVGKMWTRRGFVSHDFAAGYDQRVRQRVLDEHRADFEAATERWRMKLLPAMLMLATEAHSFAVEMEGELYDYDFELLAVEHQALQSLYALAVAKFNLGLMELNVRAAQYRGEVELAIARAENYRALANNAQISGRVNSSLASGYSSELRADGVEADAFSAAVSANEARLRAFDAEMRAVETRAQTLKAELAKYKGEVAEWAAEVAAVEADYQVSRSKNRAIVAQNRARAAEMSSEAAEQEGTGLEARALAMDAVSRSAKIQAKAASKSGEYAELEFDNLRELVDYQVDVLDYRIDAAKLSGELAPDSQMWSAMSRANASTAATYAEIGRNAIRAAEVTQQQRIELSNAVQSLYDSIGRADAARVAGELSKYRASLALRTSGDIDYSSQITRDAQYSYDVTNASSNTQRTEWVAVEEAG